MNEHAKRLRRIADDGEIDTFDTATIIEAATALDQADRDYADLLADTNDADRIEKLQAEVARLHEALDELEHQIECGRGCLKCQGKITKLEDEVARTRRERDEARRAIEKLGTNDFDWDVLGEMDRLQTEVERLQKREAVR